MSYRESEVENAYQLDRSALCLSANSRKTAGATADQNSYFVNEISAPLSQRSPKI
jgi:hypothetical protein